MRLAAIVVAALVVAGCGDDGSTPTATPTSSSTQSAAASPSPSPSPNRSPSPSPEPTPPEELAPDQAEESEALVARFPVGKRPCAIEEDADGRVFVTSFDGATVFELDPDEPSTPVNRFQTGTDPCGIAAIDGQLWVAELGTHRVVRYDPDTGEELASVAVESDPWDLQPGPDLLWATERDSGRVIGIDPATAEIAVTVDGIPLPSGLVVTDDGTVWAASEGGDAIVRINGATGEVIDEIEAPSPRWFAESPGAVWASVVGAHEVWKLDAATGEVLARVDTGEGSVPLDLGYAQGWIWSPETGRGIVQMIDPDTAEIVGELKVLTGAWVAEPIADRVWVTNFNYRVRGHVYEIDPEAMPPPFEDR